MKQMINKADLIELGFPINTARKIIKDGKEILVKKGFTLYSNKRVCSIPANIASDIIGFDVLKKER